MTPRARLAAALIVALALAVQVTVVLASPDYKPAFDSSDYVRHAVSIGGGNGYPDSVLTSSDSPSAFRPPLYPYLLGGIQFVFGEVETAGRLAGALFGALAVLLVFLIARHLWDRRTALAAAGLAAVFPGMFLLGGTLITEPLYLAIELAAVLFALYFRARPDQLRWAAAAGLCCGLAALTRSNGMLVVIPVALGVMVARPRFSRAGLLAPVVVLVVALLTVTPWAVRNSLVFDRLVGFNVQTGFGIAGTYNENAYERDGHRATWLPSRYADRYRPLYERTDLDEAELDARLRAEAVEYALDNPRYAMETTFYNALRMLQLIEEHPIGADANRRQLAFSDTEARVEQVSFYVLLLLAAAGFAVMARMPRERRPPVFIWAVPLLCIVAAFPVIGSTRYRTVVYPFLVLAAAPALVAAADRRPGRRAGAAS